MAYTSSSVPEILTPTLSEVEAIQGPLVLEFGTGWCGFCRGAQPIIEQALQNYPNVQHIKIEDGPGRALGRHFKVKLWPTLVFLLDGKVQAQLVRPTQVQDLSDALRLIAP
ncbi:thioredoxin family protein [Ottowia thiooxydans]|uniref:thioredoxin family protein n=1 Tax=Ottowia thiooxydans TaxID=219182 RepID=UPI0004212926|nr:thioredoxin family protein [Ottowia thiooxydans]